MMSVMFQEFQTAFYILLGYPINLLISQIIYLYDL